MDDGKLCSDANRLPSHVLAHITEERRVEAGVATDVLLNNGFEYDEMAQVWSQHVRRDSQ